ncbi:MAG TPA: fibronectin type III domain-containing protein [Gemmatimonadales bacterium]|nr:fibronectin type III domain-containing protein [Gemmatimonadales bacterium]
MQFPTREAEILRLANDIAAGLAAHADVFPSPPFTPADFQQAFAEHDSAREVSIQTRAAAAQSTEAKQKSLSKVEDMSKSVIRYAENVTGGDDGKLQLLGWGGRRPRTPFVLEPPGQVRTLEVIREGKDWVFLDWKEPLEGGEVAAYRVQRRKRDGGDWADAGMSVESEVTLNGQEAGVEYEYRVVAVNKAGEGAPSNIARAVL